MSETRIRIGERRSYGGALCTVRYSGDVAGTSGSWLGVEWDDPTRGKHDGQHQGVRYFSCKSKSPTAASFVRPSRAVDDPQTLVSALQRKYASDPTTAGHGEAAPQRQIVISGKVAEEVGFDKIRRQQAQLAELKIIILDGGRIAYASPPDGKPEESISEVCPKAVELDLSRNLFERVGTVVDICSQLKGLQALRMNGNRFLGVSEDETLKSASKVFKGIRELALEETLLGWDEICVIAAQFPDLVALHASANQFSSLSPLPAAPFTSTLVSIYLEFNDFTSIADIASLARISSLRNLHLKGNRISTITPEHNSATPIPVFSKTLQYLDLSYNQVSTWSFVDYLPDSFPGLTALRFAHNPIYANPELDTPSAAATTTTKAAPNTDEAYMLLLARLPALKTLNFSTITPADRLNAEMFYLSRIARQLSAAPEADEPQVLKLHRRWPDLCELYGEPAVVRRGETDPNFLEARLVAVEFRLGGTDSDDAVATKTAKIPKSFDIYAVKGIAGKLLGLPPLGLRLVWETGEWDPVAGFDEKEDGGDSSDEEEMETEWERQGGMGEEGFSQAGKGTGRWVKRETELKDGPRQFGYCVDGTDVKIRVEVR